MKRSAKANDRDMLPQYDFSGMIRGKYAGRISPNARVFLVSDKDAYGKKSAQRSVRADIKSKLQQIKRDVAELEALIEADTTQQRHERKRKVS